MSQPSVFTVYDPYEVEPKMVSEGETLEWVIDDAAVITMDLTPIERLIEFEIAYILAKEDILPAALDIIPPKGGYAPGQVRAYYRHMIRRRPVVGVLLDHTTMETLVPLVLEPGRDGRLVGQEIKDLIYHFMWSAEERWVKEFKPEQVGMLTYWTWERLKHHIPKELL